MERIILDNGDGTIAILIPSPKTIEEGWTLEQIAIKDGGGRPYEIVDESDIPTNRAFRNAWKRGAGGGVEIDIQRARSIQAARIDERRGQRIRALSDEELVKGRNWAQKIQALRLLDVASDLDSAQTPEDLEAVWPAELEE